MAKLHTIVDNFNDNSLDTGVWETTGTHAESNGRTILTPVTSGVASRLRTVLTNYDATESHIMAHIPVITATGTSGTLQAGLAITDTSTGNIAGIRKVGADLLCEKVLSGGTVTTAVYTTTYNSVNHLYWRLREAGGLFYWETSANGSGWTQLFSTTVSTNLFPLTSVRPYFITAFTGTEATPGTFQIESVNAIYLQNAVGLFAPSYTTQSVTNHTATVWSTTASGVLTTSGSLAATVITPPAGTAIRDAAGNQAVGYTNQTVDNQTTSPANTITATGLFSTGGGFAATRLLYVTATGTSGRGIAYNENIGYDEEVIYDHPNFTQGSFAAIVVPVGATDLITGSGAFTTGGSFGAVVVAPMGISAIGVFQTGGSLALAIPVVNISATGVIQLSGSLRVLTNHLVSATGQTSTGGSFQITLLSPLFQFEPPVAYDLPPTLPNPRPRYINAHARWKGGQRRGRTVLKFGSTYTIVDTPTIDQMNSADIAYQGGHVYTVDGTEAAALRAAGFVVTGTSV